MIAPPYAGNNGLGPSVPVCIRRRRIEFLI
jgi:hypothetical protein